ncbi:hypothetical protein Asfd1_45 [Aeromonas phage Asfd_1]|nr:hypothetical protein Asfd1_45 [Aeromonas phage Asfd_1]
MATIKLAPAPVFAIDRYGEVASNDHCGYRLVLECKSKMIKCIDGNCPTLKQIVNGIAEIEAVENVYVLSIESGLGCVKIKYATHPDY